MTRRTTDDNLPYMLGLSGPNVFGQYFWTATEISTGKTSWHISRKSALARMFKLSGVPMPDIKDDVIHCLCGAVGDGKPGFWYTCSNCGRRVSIDKETGEFFCKDES